MKASVRVICRFELILLDYVASIPRLPCIPYMRHLMLHQCIELFLKTDMVIRCTRYESDMICVNT